MDSALFQKGEYSFELAGAQRKGRLTYESMMRIEKRLGRSLSVVMRDIISGNIQLGDIRDILFEMMQESSPDKKLTPDAVGRMLYEGGYLKYATPLVRFVGKIMAVGTDELPEEQASGEAAAG